MPGVSGVTVVTTLVCFLFCMRGCGRIERPAFPAPSDLSEALYTMQNSRGSRGEIAEVWAVLKFEVELALFLIPPTFVGSRRAKLALGWHIVSGANDVTGGGWCRRRDILRIICAAPHPALRATLPTKVGGIRRSELRSSRPHKSGGKKRAAVMRGANATKQSILAVDRWIASPRSP